MDNECGIAHLSHRGPLYVADCGCCERISYICRLEERVYRSVYLRSSLLIEFNCSRISANLVAEESLLVIRGLGVQTSTSSSMYWSSAATRFIPTTQIQDIVIHEAFKGFEVRFYLAIIVEGESGVVVVFPVNLPTDIH